MTIFDFILKFVRFLLTPVSRVVQRRYSDKQQKRLKEAEFTILCNTCMGGVIYHRLGKKFQSPTINLWMTDTDFKKFCLNLEKYINITISFANTNSPYPIGVLDDISIHFNHAKTTEEAYRNWEERKRRILYDKIYIIAICKKGGKKEDWLWLDECPIVDYKVLCHEKHNSDGKHFIYVKPSKFGENRENLLNYTVLGFRHFEKRFDYVQFLNQE